MNKFEEITKGKIKMKKRVLKKWVNDGLSLLTLLLSVILVSINDFNLYGFIVIIAMMAAIAINVNILEKYGRKGA